MDESKGTEVTRGTSEVIDDIEDAIFKTGLVRVDKDGLPKMVDVPAEMGGSGETLPE